ncbi:MAG TPA: IPT/TIG domain-containing protein [Kofleriaceae bacterium]|nr:IPT/TIG domain-containing protein [Kofleriaceae bacterium]
MGLGLFVGLTTTGCGDNEGYVCGPGTVAQGDQCVPSGGGGGGGEAPTVASINPADGLVGGGEPFTITGTGFLEPGSGDTTVLFGDSVAAFEIVSDTEITGTVPRASAAIVEVTVLNDNGSASTEFAYTGIHGADGKGAEAGNLYLIDPRDGTSIVIGAIESDTGPHAVTGLVFAPDGTLYASETVLRNAGVAPNLMTIDPMTGAATVIGPLQTGDQIRRSPDLTYADATLVGWAEGTSGSLDQPAAIDPATGEVTLLGGGINSYGDGLATLGDGTVLAAVEGAQGALHSVDLESGTVTAITTLQGSSVTPPICGMTVFRGTLYALMCTLAGPNSGGVLATIDPDDGTITYLGSVPPNLDAIASAEPDAGASARVVVPAPRADHATAAALATAESCSAARTAAVRIAVGTPRVLAADAIATDPRAERVATGRAGARGITLAAVLGDGAAPVEAVSCTGATLYLDQADLAHHALTANQRGQLKLVDTATGTTLARGIVELRPAR